MITQDTSGMMSENIILIDAEYVDNVAFNLTVNFERMLDRRIPKADLANWLDYIALDGGLEPMEEQSIQVVFIHDSKNTGLDNFSPSDYKKEINGMAFKDNIGEFAMEAYPVEQGLTNKEDFFRDILDIAINSEKVKNIMVIPDSETYGKSVCDMIKKSKKTSTVFSMEPLMGGGFNQQILGYSLTCALGVRSDEFVK